MALTRISDDQVEQILRDIHSLGIQMVLDRDLLASLSGYYLGGRFSLCWLSNSLVAVLKTEKIQDPWAPFTDPLVVSLAGIIGFLPFCTYTNPNQRGFKIFEWKPEEFREERIRILTNMKDTCNFQTC